MTRFYADNIQFEVSESNRLEKMFISGERDFVELPRRTPSGEEITAIGNGFFVSMCNGKCNTIVIPPTISSMASGAFAYSNVKTVVWSSKCRYISFGCFYCSSIEEIGNIENVEQIGSEAFAYSKIKNVRWPDSCSVIPAHCFFGSALEGISNIDNISSVGAGAFGTLKNVKRLDFSNVLACSFGKSAFRRTDRDKISLPYYSSQSFKELQEAFA